MTFRVLLDEIKQRLQEIFKELNYPSVPYTVEPAKPGFGDVSCNAAFLLAKHLKKKPIDISKEIFSKYSSPLVDDAKAHPSGYVNFFANYSKLTKIILVNSNHSNYGSINIGKNSKLVVEHTSVNPNKALHIGHVRNIVIGDCISRILKKANFDVKVLNYIDDSGLQVADIIVGFKHLGFSTDPPENQKFDHYCGDTVYVQTTKQYETRPDLKKVRDDILKEIEKGTSDLAKFADSITKRVLASQLETCWGLSVYYDCLNFESQIIHSGLWSEIFEKLKDLKLIEFETVNDNKDCWVIRGNDKEDDKVLVRSNGTATYIAKDIPYAAWKLGLVDDPFNYTEYTKQKNDVTLWQTVLDGTNKSDLCFSGDRVITVIDSRQARLQNILMTLISKIKSDSAYAHLGYESVTLSAQTANDLGVDTMGKQVQMSGRSGLYISADSVLDLLKTKTRKETKTRNPNTSDDILNATSNDVAVGTLRYEMIKQDLDKVITFDLTKSLSFVGDTASYIQYASARATRILELNKRDLDYTASCFPLYSPYEKNLVIKIGLFDIYVQDAANNLSPKVIARYCHDMAVTFNAFYEHIKVLDSNDDNLVNARLCLVKSFQMTLQTALGLLGIKTPSQM